MRPLTIGIASSQEWPESGIVIINYDILHKWQEKLQAVEWDLVIADEAHYIKNPKARRTKQVTSIKARRKVLLTGTPIVNRPVELWPLIHYLDPKRWKSFWSYAKTYCNAYYNGYGWDFSGASNLEDLQEKLRSTIMVRRLKADVLTELPPKRRQVIELPANGASKYIAAEQSAFSRYEEQLAKLKARVELAKACEDEEEYRQAVEALRNGARAAFDEISKLRHETALAKVPYVVAHLEDVLEAEQKVVVFAHHHDVIQSIATAFEDIAVILTGEQSLEERQAAVDRFQNDPSCRLFVGSIQAAGVGITLTAARTVVFAELDWVPGNMTQAEDRCHRIGQQNSVLVQHLVLEGSLDASLAKTLVAKQEVIDRALDKASEITQVPLLPQAAATETSTRKQIAEEAARLTAEQIGAIHSALRFLAEMDTDRARAINYAGFSKVDSEIGHKLAACSSLTPKQAALGRRIVLKYHRQLPEEMIALIKEGK